MRFLSTRWILLLAVVGLTLPARAFSLLGPAAAWMTPRLGYDLNAPRSIAGGPMAIGEEYRWQVDTVYYGCSSSFLNYFGPEGSREIDKVFTMINSLPPTSKLNPDAYPLTTLRVNGKAAALFVTDLKSFALTTVLEKMGLCDPTRFVFTLRNRWIAPGGNPTNYFVIQRNYDPITWRPTSYINGLLWTYIQVFDVDDTHSFVFTDPVDPDALGGFLNAPAAWIFGGIQGSYATGLTRDDVGGLRYIYRPENYNVETVPAYFNPLQGGGGPWGAPPGTTNAVGTNTVTTNTIVTTALRGGRDKITFARADYDMLLGTFTPFTNSFTDVFIRDGVKVTQYFERGVAAPDILFHAADLQGADSGDVIVGTDNTALAWTSNTSTNGGPATLGPGVINPGDGVGPAFITTFNSVGDIWWNIYLVPWDNLDELTASTHFIFWGSYDGTPKDPIIYPIGMTVQEIEARVLNGNGDPWSSP